MIFDYVQAYANHIASIQMLLTLVNVVIHILFAGAVARDSGNLEKEGLKPVLVSGITWSFATLIRGVYVATIYWLIHHSKFTRA